MVTSGQTTGKRYITPFLGRRRKLKRIDLDNAPRTLYSTERGTLKMVLSEENGKQWINSYTLNWFVMATSDDCKSVDEVIFEEETHIGYIKITCTLSPDPNRFGVSLEGHLIVFDNSNSTTLEQIKPAAGLCYNPRTSNYKRIPKRSTCCSCAPDTTK